MTLWEKPGGRRRGCGWIAPFVIFHFRLDKTGRALTACCRDKFELVWSETQRVNLCLKGKGTISRTGIWTCTWELSSPQSSYPASRSQLFQHEPQLRNQHKSLQLQPFSGILSAKEDGHSLAGLEKPVQICTGKGMQSGRTANDLQIKSPVN